MCVCAHVCVCVCVCVCESACVGACVCVCVLVLGDIMTYACLQVYYTFTHLIVEYGETATPLPIPKAFASTVII